MISKQFIIMLASIAAALSLANLGGGGGHVIDTRARAREGPYAFFRASQTTSAPASLARAFRAAAMFCLRS